MSIPLQCKILHISDLHFIENDNSQLRPELTLRGIKNKFSKIDFICITGDITDAGLNPQFNNALYFINELKSILKEENPQNIYFVPGNHDVNCTQEKSKTRREINKHRFGDYIKFVNIFLGQNPDLPRIHWRGDERGADRLNTSIFLKSNIDWIDFILLNSVSKFEYRDKEKAKIEIHKNEIDYFKNLKDEIMSRNTFKIALLHNPPLKFWSDEQKFVRNSNDLLTVLCECGVNLILHGDMHDLQHISAARYLDAQPLYIIGAGRINKGVTGVPHFHILNLTFWEKFSTVEIEVLSYNVHGNKICAMEQKHYDLYMPMKDLYEIEEPNPCIHMFELSEPNRDKYCHRLGKDLLFAFRSHTFKFLKKTCTELHDKDRGTTTFSPDYMYSIFYRSVFDSAYPGNVFRAVHDQDWKAWLKDTNNREVLEQHFNASNKGVNIQRIIVLDDESESGIKQCYEHDKTELVKLCTEMDKLWVEDRPDGGCFKTYLAKKSDLKNYYSISPASSATPEVNRIMEGNIALFTQGRKIDNATRKNTIVFFFEEHKEGKIMANLSVQKDVIERIKELLSRLWAPEIVNNILIECRKIKTALDVENLIKHGPKYLNQDG